jgi:hypothetical protein
MGWMHYLPALWMFYEPTAIRVLVAVCLAFVVAGAVPWPSLVPAKARRRV